MIDSIDDVLSLCRNKSVHRKWDNGYISAYIYTHVRLHDQIMPQKWLPTRGLNEI